MYYETSTNDHGLRHNPLKACVLPRPIGWLTTISAAGVVNLAPFSFFNLLSYDPPFVMFSAGTHELDAAGLEPLSSRLVRPPRVKGAPVHFECRLHEIVQLPGRTPRAAHHLVIGRVLAVHIDDAALTAEGRVDVLKIRPIARLGYKDFTSVDSVFEMEKSMPEDGR